MLRPNLASHAPNVNKIILICGMRIVDKEVLRGINKTIHSIIASRQNKDIRR